MRQILVYGDSLTWGVIPDTRRRLPFEARWPGVLAGELLARGERVRVIEDCLNGRFFDAATVTTSSQVDGVHLDADQHAILGRALAPVVSRLLGRRGTSAARSSVAARSDRDPRPTRPRGDRRRPR